MTSDQRKRELSALRQRRHRARLKERDVTRLGRFELAVEELETDDRRRRDHRDRQRRYRQRKRFEDLEIMARMGHLEICTPSRCVSGCLVARYGPPPDGYEDEELQAWADQHGYFDEHVLAPRL